MWIGMYNWRNSEECLVMDFCLPILRKDICFMKKHSVLLLFGFCLVPTAYNTLKSYVKTTACNIIQMMLRDALK